MSITDTSLRLSELALDARPAALAGSFYPANAAKLRQDVRSFLAKAQATTDTPKALVVPHAGHRYSGSTAANGFASLQSIKHSIRRVILLGPAHRVYLEGMALPTHTHFETPLGRVPVDQDCLQQLKQFRFVQFMDAAHAEEHCLEVQLPFLQDCLDDFSLVPIVVGDVCADDVAAVLEALWGGNDTLILISSDLSHFHDYEKAVKIDSATSELIEKLSFENISPQQACGARPLRGLLKLARKRGMSIKRLGLCNSGDTAGDRQRVVGYGCWALFEPESLLQEHKSLLKDLAHQSIEHGLQTNKVLALLESDYPSVLCRPAACFVTLKIADQLRGCIDSLEAQQPLLMAVADSAFKAAFKDPRFKALTSSEYEQVSVSISILSPQQAVSFDDENHLLQQLQAGIHGLTIAKGSHRATFLPSVWSNLPDKQQFLLQLKRKAGIGLSEQVEKAWFYTAESID